MFPATTPLRCFWAPDGHAIALELHDALSDEHGLSFEPLLPQPGFREKEVSRSWGLSRQRTKLIPCKSISTTPRPISLGM